MKHQHNPRMQIEIETKLDVPLSLPDLKVISDVKHLLNKECWEIINERADEKDLCYYDSPDLKLHNEGSTLRRVTPFDIERYPGRVRYDFKQGKGELRLEAKGWSSDVLRSEEIISLLALEKRVNQIRPIVQVHITPLFLDIQKGDLEAELKLDTCSYQGKPLFRELEIELKNGDPSELYKTSDLISDQFGFRYLHQQKYSRVIDILQIKGGKS